MLNFAFSSDWQILLSIFAPSLMAAGLFGLTANPRVAAFLKSCAGVVPPYFVAISTTFALFGALLTGEVWNKVGEAKHAVQQEGEALGLLADLTRPAPHPTITPLLREYAEVGATENWRSPNPADTRGGSERVYHALTSAIVSAGELDGTLRTALLSAAGDLTRARSEQRHLVDDVTAPIKWIAILVFGALTLISLVLVHPDNRRAMIASVSLFAITMIFSLLIVAAFDAPFEFVLADEPRATLLKVMTRL